MTASDKKWIEDIRSGNSPRYAFDQLIRSYQEPLYWAIRRVVKDHDGASDVLQNTFVKVWQNVADFRGDSELYSWMFRIARNEALTYIRKEAKHNSVEGDPALFDSGQSFYGKERSGEEIEQLLQRALDTLPDKQRAVFELKYFDEMKYSEMSELLGTSEGALKASYHHATKKIEEFLKSL